jgi:hypothetical protein
MRIVRFVFGVIWGVLALMIQVSSDHATNLLAGWFRDGGLLGVADFLGSPTTDFVIRHYAVWVLTSLAFFCLFAGPISAIGKLLFKTHVLELSLDSHFPYGSGVTGSNKIVRYAIASVSNRSDKTVKNCQISLWKYFVCAPFDLRPGQNHTVPIIELVDWCGGSYAQCWTYMNSGNGWTKSEIRWMPKLGDYDLKLIADDIPPFQVKVNLSFASDWKVTKLSKLWCIARMPIALN